MNEKNNVLVIFYVIIVPRQQKNILRHNDRFIENGKSLSSNIFRKVVLNHKYQKNIHVAFINSVWFLADCRKIIKHLLSLDHRVFRYPHIHIRTVQWHLPYSYWYRMHKARSVVHSHKLWLGRLLNLKCVQISFYRRKQLEEKKKICHDYFIDARILNVGQIATTRAR